MSRENSRFQSGSGVYKCEHCGRRTRETGQGEDGRYCACCSLIFEAQNSFVDGAMDEEGFREMVAHWKKRYRRPFDEDEFQKLVAEVKRMLEW